MIIYQCSHAIAGSRIEGADTILDASQTILLRAHPKTTIWSGGHGCHLMTCQWSFIAYDTLIACAIPNLTISIFCDGSDITID